MSDSAGMSRRGMLDDISAVVIVLNMNVSVAEALADGLERRAPSESSQDSVEPISKKKSSSSGSAGSSSTKRSRSTT